MDEPSIDSMNEQDRQISEIVVEERSRLRNFIRQRVPDPSDAEDIVQEVFYELVQRRSEEAPRYHGNPLNVTSVRDVSTSGEGK
jgi:DNA-directed RNA polymerase specialized sigma24 family protein